jgi:CubicO group peptidase (beta-lactamase class C family)
MKHSGIITTVLFISISFGRIFGQNVSISKNDLSAIAAFIDSLSNGDKFSGTVLIAKGKEILFQHAFGQADKEDNINNDINTKFNIASMGKMFTGIAIAQLVEKGRISYTDKVMRYLPDLPENVFGKITIEQLLTHRSGLGDFFDNPRFWDIKDTAKTINSYMSLIGSSLEFEPGARFMYSNSGYILLGAIIEKISRQSYYDFVRTNIFLPAGMENTGYFETDKFTPNMAMGYATPPNQNEQNQSEKTIRENNKQMLEVKGTSAGGAYSTAPDLYKFSEALLNSKLISQESFNTVTTGKVLMPKRPINPVMKPPPDIKYGYGFGEFFINNVRIIGHNGGSPGVDAQMDIYPDSDYTVVVLSNYDRSVLPVVKFIENILTSSR